MYKSLVILVFLFLVSKASAQKAKDTLIYNLPVVNDKLIYQGAGSVPGRDKATLDSLAKSWVYGFLH
jgi:hypothetical protein